MGLSFHHKSSMRQASINLSSTPDIGKPKNVVDERRQEDFEIQLSDYLDIQMVDRWIGKRQQHRYC